MKEILVPIFIAIFISTAIVDLHSQVTGIVTDLATGVPIENANIAVHLSAKGTQTNQEGFFELTISETPARLTFTHLNYEAEVIYITDVNQKVKLSLIAKSTLIDEVVISDNIIPEKITDNINYSISDFLWWGNELLLLEFHGDFKKSFISRWSKDGELLCRTKLTNVRKTHSLYKSCNDQIYLLGNTKMYSLSFTEDLSYIDKSYPIDFLTDILKPCKLVLDKNIYYESRFHNDLLSIFNVYNSVEERTTELAKVGAIKKIESFQNDLEYITTGKGYTNSFKSLRQIQQDADFFVSVLYKPSFEHYLFYVDGKLILLDHLNGKMRFYEQLTFSYSSDIDYQQKDNWTKMIVQDEITSKIYTFFRNQNKIDIHSINIIDGSTSWVKSIETKFRNLPTFQIHNNRLYYMEDISIENANDIVFELALD